MCKVVVEIPFVNFLPRSHKSRREIATNANHFPPVLATVLSDFSESQLPLQLVGKGPRLAFLQTAKG